MTQPTLADVLARRDARAARQRELLDERHMPLVSITVVAPGPVKDSERARRLRDEAADVVLERLRDVEGWAVWHDERHDGPTGPEALLAVDGEPGSMKRALIDVEERHPWGRLFDLDVVLDDGPVARARVGAAPRSCLVCERPAAECARSRRHPLPELEARVAEIVARD